MSGKKQQTNRSNFFDRHRRLWIALGLAIALFLVTVFLILPPALSWGLEKWIESQGRLEATVEDVDFNLFSGNLVVHSLLAERHGEGGFKWNRAALEIAWWPILKKRIRFNDISMSNASFNIVQEPDGELYAGGFRIREAEAATEPKVKKTQTSDEGGWEIGLGDIDLQNVRVRYHSPKATRQVMIRKAHIDPLQSWNQSSAGEFNIQLAVDQGTIDIQGSAKPYSPTASAEGQVKIRDLPLDWGAPWLRQLEITQVGGTLAADTDFSLALGDQVRASLEGSLTLQQVQAQTPQATVRPMSLNWDGKLQASLPQAASPRITAEGTLSAQRPDVILTAQDLAAEARSIRIQGNFQSHSEGSAEPAAFVFSGKMDAAQLRVDQMQNRMNLARIEHLDTADLHLEGLDRILVSAANLRDGRLLERSPETPQPTASEKEYVLTFGRLALRDVSVSPVDKRLEIGAATLSDAQGNLIRDEQGRFQIMERLKALKKEFGTPVPEKAKRAGWQYALGAGAIEDNSRVRFLDRSVNPAVELTAAHIQAGIQHLDSTAAKPVPIDIQADLGRYATFQAQGTLQPGAPISMNIEGQIKQFSLPEVRGYARDKLGYTIHSGQLYADFQLLARDGQLDSEIKLFLASLQLNRPPEREAGPIEAELGMPLNSALNLLRNRDGNIRLRLPVTGSLADPDIGMGQVVAKALRNATYKGLKTAVLSYFAPLGAAYAAGKLLGKAFALRLDPIVYDAAQVQLADAQMQYLDQVAQKLRDRPETSLLICGKASNLDRQALRQASQVKEVDRASSSAKAGEGSIPDARLLALAERRAENTREYLAKQGIDSQRLMLCAPSLDETQGAQPTVELAV